VISHSILLICLAAATVEETPFICNNDIFNFILTSPVAVTNSGTLSIDREYLYYVDGIAIVDHLCEPSITNSAMQREFRLEDN
jgi:hypothetical protein